MMAIIDPLAKAGGLNFPNDNLPPQLKVIFDRVLELVETLKGEGHPPHLISQALSGIGLGMLQNLVDGPREVAPAKK